MWTFITKFKGNSKAQLCMFISLKSGRKFTISIHLIYQEIIFFKAWLWYILFLEFKCLLLFRLEHHCLIPKTNFTFLYSPPWQQKIFSSTIAAIGRQLKQSVNVFQSLMLYRRLPTKHSVRLLYVKLSLFQKIQKPKLHVLVSRSKYFFWLFMTTTGCCPMQSNCLTGIQICWQCTENNTTIHYQPSWLFYSKHKQIKLLLYT